MAMQSNIFVSLTLLIIYINGNAIECICFFNLIDNIYKWQCNRIYLFL